MTGRTAILLVNLGTPAHPTHASVRAYLREFLSDPRVVDLPAPARWVLLHAVILPFRTPKSLQAYQAIWMAEGSPLRVYSERLARNLQALIGGEAEVVLGMRYGQPKLASLISGLKNYRKIIVLPLFPQYASATTGSIIDEILKEMTSWHTYPELTLVNEFYDHPAFIAALCTTIKASLGDFPAEHLVFSYHGVPLRQLPKSSSKFCYKSECYQTSHLVAQALGWDRTDYTVAFQSRLGRARWIEPELLATLKGLADRGLKNIAVVCPSFVVDCLETLEEVGLRARAWWVAETGGELQLLSCLNEEAGWLKNLLAPYLKA